MEIKGISFKTTASKKILAVVLSVLILLTAIPVGLVTSVKAAAANDCMAIEVAGKKVYFFGAETLEADEVESTVVHYTTSAQSDLAIYVDGKSEVDTTGVTVNMQENTIDFGTWLANQDKWVAVQLDDTKAVPTAEPNVEVDKTAPEITDVLGNPSDWTNKDVTLTVEAKDNDGGTGVVAYSKDRTNWQAEATFNITENGTYTFYVKDAVGNISEVTENSTTEVEYIDKTAPEIYVSYNPETWTNNAITVTVKATDNKSGIPETGAYSLDSESDWQDDNKFTISDNVEHTVYVKDNAGNIGSTKFTAVQYDDVAPTVSSIKLQRNITGSKWDDLNIKEDYTSKNAKYQIVIEATDKKDNAEGSGVTGYYVSEKNIDEYILNKDFDKISENTTYYETSTISVEAGSHFYVYAKDNVGNISTNGYEVSLREDSTSPEVNHELSDLSQTSKEITVTVSATDASRIDSYFIDDSDKLDIDAVVNKKGKYTWNDKELDKNTFTLNDSKVHYLYVIDGTGANYSVTEVQATNFNDGTPKISAIQSKNDDNKTKWMNTAIQVEVSANPTINGAGTTFEIKEYGISDSANSNIKWQEGNTFEITDCKTHYFYVKDCTDKVSESSIYTADNFDNKTPELAGETAVKFTQKNDGKIAKILNKLTFGRFFNKTLVITVEAEDVADEDETNNASGIVFAQFVFKDADNKNEYTYEPKNIGNNEKATIKFEVTDLPDNFKGTAEIVLKDAARNEETYQVTTENSDMGEIDSESDFSFMIENNEPKFKDNTVKKNAGKPSNERVYANSFEFSARVSDDNFGEDKTNVSGIAYVEVLANNYKVYSEDLQGNKSNIDIEFDVVGVVFDQDGKIDNDLSYTVNGENLSSDYWDGGQITFKIKAYDNSGNFATSEGFTYSIDQTAPVISVFEFKPKNSNEENKTVSVEYNDDDYSFFFKDETTVTITATDKTNPANLEVTASGVASITAYLKDENKKTYYEVVEDDNGALLLKTIDNPVSKDGKINLKAINNDRISFTVPAGFKGQIYAFATDKAGNSPTNAKYFEDRDEEHADKSKADVNGFVHPKGTIIENADKHTEESSIDFTMPKTNNTQNTKFAGYSQKEGKLDAVTDYAEYLKTASSSNVPLYNNDFKANITFKDSYSGINTIKLTVFEGSKSVVKTVKFDNAGKNTSKDDVTYKIVKKDSNLVTNVVISDFAVKGNYNDMVLVAELKDNAGNISYDYFAFGIDKTAPEITVEYESSASPETNNYYNKTRSAYITIKERNITTQDVQLLIEKCTNMERDFSANDKTEYKNSFNIEKNKIKDGSGNHDDRTYRIKVNFDKDGNYRIKTLNCADTAGNKNKTVVYKKYGSASNKDDVTAKNRTLFTIDKTKPVINVSLDLNDQVHNKKYFNKTRTATITVTERNFDTSDKADFVNNITATLNGNTISKPVVSSFKRQGKTDKWVATVKFEADGDYTLAFNATDKAGNSFDVKKDTSGVFSGNAASDFTIDKTAPTVSITNALSNNHSYKDVPVIVLTEKDNNCSNITSSVEGTYYDADAKELKRISLKANSNGVLTADHRTQNEVKYSVVEEDGIYTITVSCVDLAGNKSDTKTLRFTKNAKGSVFVPSEDLSKLDNGYANSDNLSSNLVIDEYSANETENAEYYININGKQTDNKNIISRELVKDSDSANGGWYHYRYVINKNEIHAEGKYSVYIKSSVAIDKNNTIQNNASANDKLHRIDINFTIDNTNPYVKISGLDRHTYIKTEKVPVDFYITDSNLSYVKVWVYDSNGTVDENTVPTYTWNAYNEDNEKNNILDWTEKDGLIYVSFELPASDSSLNVKFEIADKAGNKCCKDSDFNKNEIFVTGVEEGQSAGFFEIGDNNAIVLRSISINKNLSLSAVASIIKDNIKLAVVIIVAVILVLAAIIILPIISKRRKKLDAEDEGLID